MTPCFSIDVWGFVQKLISLVTPLIGWGASTKALPNIPDVQPKSFQAPRIHENVHLVLWRPFFSGSFGGGASGGSTKKNTIVTDSGEKMHLIFVYTLED